MIVRLELVLACYKKGIEERLSLQRSRLTLLLGLYREAVAIKRKRTSSQKRKGRKRQGKVKSKKKKNTQKQGKKSKSKSNNDQPLNKGPYGFEHPDVVDVRR